MVMMKNAFPDCLSILCMKDQQIKRKRLWQCMNWLKETQPTTELSERQILTGLLDIFYKIR